MFHTIITAGGKGLRMGAEIPKQFLNLAGKPILLHTLEKFDSIENRGEIVVVLPENEVSTWQEILKKFDVKIPHQITTGGTTRFLSIQNGLAKLPDSGYLAIHDGVRPLLSKHLIYNAFEQAIKHKAVIPVIDITDSLREITSENTNKSIDRNRIKAVQTPQVFEINLLKAAYKNATSTDFTDDAAVVEAFGHPVHLISGEKQNIKITQPFDLIIAEQVYNLL